jgi:hypothetical protein
MQLDQAGTKILPSLLNLSIRQPNVLLKLPGIRVPRTVAETLVGGDLAGCR